MESDVFHGDREGMLGVPESGKELLENGIIEGSVTYQELKSGNKVIIDKNLLHWYPDLNIGDVIDVITWDGDKKIRNNWRLQRLAIMIWDLQDIAI